MGLFGKKKKVEAPPVEDLPPLPTLESLDQGNNQQNLPRPPLQMPVGNPNLPNQIQQPVKWQEPQQPQERYERPVFAPVFVKIDRYRGILNALGQLRTSVMMIRNSFATLNELEKARFETLKLIEDAVSRLNDKLAVLDSELLRPTGHHPEASPEYQDVETVHATVADLKGQIDQLKTELQQMG